MRIQIIILFLLLSFISFADEQCALPQGLTVDLREPTFSQGVLSTDKGGVIQAPDVRIQAQNLQFTRKTENGVSICTLYAEKNLIIEIGDYYFVGSAVEYDFNTNTGVIYNATTSLEPWFFGGEKIILHADGSFTLYNGYITTSESKDVDWEFTAEETHFYDRSYVEARQIKLKIYQIPLLWLPSLKTNLDTIFDAPIRYQFKWGGHRGTRATMIYEVFNWNRFKLFARLDYRFKRGFGGGIETYYSSEDHREIFNTINYVANDNSISNPHEHYRYRFQGLYHNQVYNDTVSIDLTWDKLSDRDMATDYDDRGLELDIAGRTSLLIRRQEENHIERLITNLKVNQFETVNQELPTLELSYRPRVLGETGIISTSLLRASYLDFSYSNDVWHPHDFNSTRVAVTHTLYRPFPTRFFTITPEIGALGIYYGNSPQREERWLGIAFSEVELKASLSKQFENCKHILEPYVRATYLTAPTASPSEHYIFNIEDGWFHANYTRVGVLNQFFTKNSFGFLTRPFSLDLFTYVFIDTPTIGATIPKGYLSFSMLSYETVRHTLDAAWDFQHGNLDFFNFRTVWTAASNLAIAGEYRHRSRFDWRKADRTNFILDSYRSESQLLRSPLSDRRDTLLTSLYYQFTPNWAFFFEMRHGWNRRTEPAYTEFETDFIATLPSAWNLKFSYQHKEDDDRVAIYFSIGLNKPNLRKCASRIPCLEL